MHSFFFKYGRPVSSNRLTMFAKCFQWFLVILLEFMYLSVTLVKGEFCLFIIMYVSSSYKNGMHTAWILSRFVYVQASNVNEL